jgi:hypothetical protein
VANRLYSFRYPFDILTTLEGWREKLSSPLTGSYDSVVARMADRDRALEDYLSLGVGQGYLGRATLTSTQTGLVVADTDVTGLTLDVMIPANRVLKIAAYVEIDNEAAATGLGFLKIKEDGTQITVRQPPLDVNGGLREFCDVDFSVFTTPAAGKHTYKVTAGISTNNGRLVHTSQNPGFLTVEDVGPVNT